MPLPEAIIAVLAPFRPLFTAPTWRKLMTLLIGTLLAHGRRTVCSALRFSGEQMNENWSTYHHVLNRARGPACSWCVHNDRDRLDPGTTMGSTDQQAGQLS